MRGLVFAKQLDDASNTFGVAKLLQEPRQTVLRPGTSPARRQFFRRQEIERGGIDGLHAVQQVSQQRFGLLKLELCDESDRVLVILFEQPTQSLANRTPDERLSEGNVELTKRRIEAGL